MGIARLPRATWRLYKCSALHTIWQTNACTLLLLSANQKQACPCDDKLISLTHGVSGLAGINPCFQRGGCVPCSRMQVL